jgi:hypothetical protein
MNTEQRRAVVFGVLFVAIGVLFLLEALEVFEIAPATLWPLLLVAIGVGVLAGTGASDDEGPIR